jgi:DNA-binding MarR family transcriptional regulator
VSSEQAEHAALVQELLDVLRRSSAAGILFQQAVAERLGLNTTDHKCLDLLVQMGPVTAGRLAELTGLTTGAITGVVDRLERAGFVRRERDPHDRRRVILQPVRERVEEVGPIFDSLSRAARSLCARYSVEELAVILDFNRRSLDLMREQAARLRAESGEGLEEPGAG